jgi:beta-glucosidase
MNKLKFNVINGGLVLLCLGCFAVKAQAPANGLPQLGKSPVKDVIAAMTLKEKAEMVIGGGRKSARSAVSDGPMIGYTEYKVPGAAGITNAIPRLGIPSMVLADGPAGLRITPQRKGETKTYYATAFPVGTLLASTWDPAVVYGVGKAFGNEVLEYGVDIILAPGVNIHRNPLNGRNFEYYSEDPLVAGKMAGAIINGMQSNGIGTSIKHFAANNQETKRGSINAIVSERALREIYLKGFEIAIKESQPWTVMSSYNKLNGNYTAEKKDLLTTVLRDEWGFKGYVMSDWAGLSTDLVAQVNAGNDVIMPGKTEQINKIISAVQHDSLDVKMLDRNIEHLLNIVLKSPAFKGYKYSNDPDLKAHGQVSRKAAAEGMVLLKNEANALPLAKRVNKIAAFGNTSYNLIAGGFGSGNVNKAYTISLAQGLTNAGYQQDAELEQAYLQYIKGSPKTKEDAYTPEMAVSDDMIAKKANECDIAIMTIGRNAGEGVDRKLDTNYNLVAYEKELIQRVATRFHQKGKKLIVVLNIGGVINMAGWKNNADGILLAWQPGQEGGDAITDLLSGKVDPSGKLASTFAQNYEDVPSAKNFPGTPLANPTEVTYEEGIYVGYRYYDTFDKIPAYEFGYGLSYTNFTVTNLKLSSTTLRDSIKVTALVTNTGKVAGKEVVQIYISAPVKTIDKPAQELKAFAKTKLLKPGESQKLSFVIRTADVASFYSSKNEWLADAGQYILKAGTSSRQIKQTVKFAIAQTIITEKVNNVLQPSKTINEYRPK